MIHNKTLFRPFSADSLPRNKSYLWLDKNENLDPHFQKVIKRLIRYTVDSSRSYPEAAKLYCKLSRWLKVSKKVLY